VSSVTVLYLCVYQMYCLTNTAGLQTCLYKMSQFYDDHHKWGTSDVSRGWGTQ